jgi:hypothetical protein
VVRTTHRRHGHDRAIVPYDFTNNGSDWASASVTSRSALAQLLHSQKRGSIFSVGGS